MKNRISKWITALVLLLAFALSGCGAQNSFLSAVKDGNYSKAIELYEKNIVGNSGRELKARDELQSFLDYYPYTRLKLQTQEMIQRLQDHLVEKELRTAKLYYDLGDYFMNCSSGGSNYEACIVTAENALRDYPYALPERREEFMILILRSRYHLARQSVEAKRLERFRQAVDEYYGFANEFPESNYLKEAQTYLVKSQKALKGQPLDE